MNSHEGCSFSFKSLLNIIIKSQHTHVNKDNTAIAVPLQPFYLFKQRINMLVYAATSLQSPLK